MFKIAIIVLVAVVALVLLYAASRPDTFRVERSTVIHASQERLFPLINDLHAWQTWTPYDKDPAMKKTFGPVPSGPGATYAWEGNAQVGAGDIRITGATPPGRIDIELHMIKPFEALNQVAFILEIQGDHTRVTWAMEGRNNLLGKVVGLFMNMDRMVGTDFEKGLANLKLVAEK